MNMFALCQYATTLTGLYFGYKLWYDKNNNNKKQLLRGTMPMIFLPANSNANNIRNSVENVVRLLQNKPRHSWKRLIENYLDENDIRVIMWDNSGNAIATSMPPDFIRQYSEDPDKLEYVREKNDADFPEKLVTDELLLWERLTKKKRGVWCVTSVVETTDQYSMECMYVTRYNDCYITAGYTF